MVKSKAFTIYNFWFCIKLKKPRYGWSDDFCTLSKSLSHVNIIKKKKIVNNR